MCLEALARVEYPDFEVLVVDNASSDVRTREIARRWRVGYLIEPVVGLSRARNLGAESCDTEIVAFIDDDAIPEPSWLSSLLLEFEDSLVMVVTGRMIPVSVETDAERLSASINTLVSERRVVDHRTPSWFEITNFGGLSDGWNMAFRRAAFAVWPGFDERLGRGSLIDGGEEHHAFFSLVDSGYRAVYTPNAVVKHPLARSLQDLRQRYLRDLSASAAYFVLLFVEQPHYRRRILRYLGQSLVGIRRPWRSQVPVPRIVSWGRAFLACLIGPFIYLRAWLAWRARPTASIRSLSHEDRSGEHSRHRDPKRRSDAIVKAS
jgi:cellulose synthase/poly-beta-1,6-N-acetylglucosamine synthase-like glycosyltransferase